MKRRHKNWTTLLFLFAAAVAFAQTRSTKEAKVVMVVNEKNTRIIGLELFNEKDANSIKKRYPESKFYIGLLRGSYELEKRGVTPNTGATIIIFTERQILPDEDFFQKENFVPGNQLDFGEAKTKIISNAKGELVLEAQ